MTEHGQAGTKLEKPGSLRSEPRATNALPSLEAGAQAGGFCGPPRSAGGSGLAGAGAGASLLVLFAQASPSSAVWEGERQPAQMRKKQASSRFSFLEPSASGGSQSTGGSAGHPAPPPCVPTSCPRFCWWPSSASARPGSPHCTCASCFLRNSVSPKDSAT